MFGSTFGHLLRLTTFGESHGPGIGGVIDGCPSGIAIDEELIQRDLDRRKPGAGLAGTTRVEKDRVSLLSGVFEGKTTGTPIAFFIANESQRSADYSKLAAIYRPGHADYSYDAKYGLRDYRGGGRASARETAARVAGGAIASAILAGAGAKVYAATEELGGLPVPEIDMEGAFERPYFSAHDAAISAWEEALKAARSEGDSLGGIVRVEVRGLPSGLGEPVFGKLDAMLAAAVMSVGAVKGVEIGAGFAAARLKGSQNNDPIISGRFASNNAGGILGGISSGQDIVLRAAVKPIPSISMPQETMDRNGNPVQVNIGGRHDVCAIPRVVPVISAMTALALADALLLQRRLLTSSVA